MNQIIEIDDAKLAETIVFDIEEQSKPNMLSKKIAEATELINRVGLPEIERPKEAVTLAEFKEVLYQLDFHEEIVDNLVTFAHGSTQVHIKLLFTEWIPAGWIRLKSKILVEKELITDEEELLNKIIQNRLALEV